MSESTQETIARVDELLKRFDAARAQEAKEKAMQADKAASDDLLKEARARKKSEALWAKLDRWEAERKERDKTALVQRSEWLAKYRANVTQADGFGVTCGECGHVGNFDDFTTDKLGFERPRGVFQCPACSAAIRRQADKGTGNIILKPIQATL